jgi:predicted transcriptional regulator
MRRDSISTRLDPEVLEVVQHVAEVERRPVSHVIRNVLADWVESRVQAEQQPAAAGR